MSRHTSPRTDWVWRVLLASTLAWSAGCAGSSPGPSGGGANATTSADDTAEGGEAVALESERTLAEEDSSVDVTAPSETLRMTESGQPRPDGAAPTDLEDEDSVAPRASLALLRQLERVEGGLPQALSAGRCADAGGIRDHICALASRVCTLAGSEPENEMLDSRCEDARRRCQSATTRVAERCGG